MRKEKENIDDSFLKNLPQNDGFTTPEGYFESVELTILAKIKLNESLHLGNSNGHLSVSNAYFENNKNAILSKTKAVKNTPIININWKWVSGIAAILLAVYGLNELKTTNLITQKTNKVSDTEIIDYLTNNDVKLEWINEVNPNFVFQTNNSKEIEQYLLDHAEEQVILDEL